MGKILNYLFDRIFVGKETMMLREITACLHEYTNMIDEDSFTLEKLEALDIKISAIKTKDHMDKINFIQSSIDYAKQNLLQKK